MKTETAEKVVAHLETVIKLVEDEMGEFESYEEFEKVYLIEFLNAVENLKEEILTLC